MGYYKELLIRRANANEWRVPEDEIVADLATIAAALGGELDGNFVRCPSPGRPPDDRSCFARFYAPDSFYIYECEGSERAAYAFVRSRLNLREPVRRDQSEIISATLSSVDCGSADGTVVEQYLRARALTLPLPSCLLFHKRLFHKPSGCFFPAMIAERRDVHGALTAIHRTFLDWRTPRKAPVEPQRMDLGPTAGTAIRLSAAAEELIVAEGIETTLSAIQATGGAGWAAGSAKALELLILPPEVRRVTIAADGDEPGERAARRAAARWAGEGRDVKIARAPRGKDFNDMLMEGVR
ncbi:toprim domain-containing protein [Bradyrhizobium sp. 147]|uniref:DUF7146 domain-containing protein n=1 Tax=Bradyrhizobium sp. 147 TaxID=2782623 RepID=UPI001FFA25A3|nr:toprim domain-containing protein [Bradyrhizobium sp. 147]MCK1679408.1 toprim domain-containing protein [Bradyrhizobium sp. 147]